MAKGKNLNPADAHRKALRKKELKKNKEERKKVRDFALVKKDTTELENEVAELEGLGDKATSVQRARLGEVKAELARIMSKKDEYVTEHPEQRGLVYRRRKEKEKEEEEEGKDGDKGKPAKKTRRLFHEHGSKKGLPRHPERSIYYDPIMNPFGVPPPGMPYAERPLLPGEIDSEAEEVEADGNASDDSDDIPLPPGPPPGAPADEASEEDGSDDDDIPLPPGPPPTEQDNQNFVPPLPPGPPPLNAYQILPAPTSTLPPMPPPNFIPTPPPIPGSSAVPSWLPPPPPMPMSYNAPPPPPGFYPRAQRAKNTSVMQDPLSDTPHVTFQERRARREVGAGAVSGEPGSSTLPSHPNLPPRPGAPPPLPPSSSSSMAPAPTAASASATATIFAEPELRDFKKESTAFVPTALKRKKGLGGAGRSVNAAPVVASEDGAAEAPRSDPKPDLLGALRDKLGPMASASANGSGPGEDMAKRRRVEASGNAQGQGQKQQNTDYDKFIAEMGDLLAAPSKT